jgi:SAM-dependent methyltransferase
MLGVDEWPRELAIAELFCGRGNGLCVLEGMGFKNLRGVDLSVELLKQFGGRSPLFVGDCRSLHFPTESLDAVVIQGGLHHLPNLNADLVKTLDEIARTLRPGGRLLIVEPWRTPMLDAIHRMASQPLVRRIWSRVDALQTMIEREADTYFEWLSKPALIQRAINGRFTAQIRKIAFGKLMYLGRKPTS